MTTPFRVCFRTFCSTTVLLEKKYNFVKNQSRFLDKMLQKNLSRKKSAPSGSGLLSKGHIPSAYENENTSRRMNALNKIFMENIIPMLHGGKSGSKLSDLGIEIPKVEITSDLQYLNIFWITTKPEIPEEILNKVLQEALRELQSQMGTLRFCSIVPYVRFVKDERLEREIQLEKIFEMADYGEDYEPVYSKKVFTQTSTPDELPKLRDDVLGVNHAKIKGEIMAKIFRHKAINTQKVESEGDESQDSRKYETPEKLIPFSRKSFFKFYKRRRIMALKRLKRGEYDF